RVVLGGVVGVESAAVIGLDELQPLLVEYVHGKLVAIEVVENAEFHFRLLRSCSMSRSSSRKAAAATRSGGCPCGGSAGATGAPRLASRARTPRAPFRRRAARSGRGGTARHASAAAPALL